MERNAERMLEEIKALNSKENMELVEKYYMALINDDVETAVKMTLRIYDMVSVETLACLTETMMAVSEKISDYYYDHIFDEDISIERQRAEKMDKLTELVEILQDQREELEEEED